MLFTLSPEMNYLSIFGVAMKIVKYYHKKPIWLTGFIVWTLFIIFVSVIPNSKEVLPESTSTISTIKCFFIMYSLIRKGCTRW